MRSEPAVSDPSATAALPLATAPADPEDDPPAMKSRFHGFRTRPRAWLYPDGSYASSGRPVNPTRRAPAPSSRAKRSVSPSMAASPGVVSPLGGRCDGG